MASASSVFATDFTNLDAVKRLAQALSRQSPQTQYVVKHAGRPNYNITMQFARAAQAAAGGGHICAIYQRGADMLS